MMAQEAPESWKLRGACRGRDPELWFDPATEREKNQAKRICAACPVLATCGEHALAKPEPYGIWGGMTEDQRRKLRKARGLHVGSTKPEPTRARPRRSIRELTETEVREVLRQLDAGVSPTAVGRNVELGGEQCRRLWSRHRQGNPPGMKVIGARVP